MKQQTSDDFQPLNLKVWKQESPPSPFPYHIIETYLCADGTRTRIVSGSWDSLARAEAECLLLLADMNRSRPDFPKAAP